MSESIQLRMIELLPRLRRFALTLCGERDRADDLVQETCARALANADQWRPDTRLDSWLYRIAQNLWFDQVRARKSRGENVDVENLVELAGVDGRDVVESRQTLELVSKKIAELPPEQQVLIALVCVDGLSYREAAETLGVPIGTVMSRLSRARIALNSAMLPTYSSNELKVRRANERNIK